METPNGASRNRKHLFVDRLRLRISFYRRGKTDRAYCSQRRSDPQDLPAEVRGTVLQGLFFSRIAGMVCCSQDGQSYGQNIRSSKNQGNGEVLKVAPFTCKR